jgi:hypothetical protein
MNKYIFIYLHVFRPLYRPVYVITSVGKFMEKKVLCKYCDIYTRYWVTTR